MVAHSLNQPTSINELDADLYLPFRYQLTLKVVFLTAMFCPAIPLLLPFASAFMFASHRVDRHSRSALPAANR